MKIFNKLVRDKIPEIIQKNNETPIVRILDDKTYELELEKKLQEEVNEYFLDKDIEELADIEEVIRALVELKGLSYKEFDAIRESKCEQRGSFRNKIFLEGTR